MAERKEIAPKYTPDRASMILAEAEFFGDSPTCKKWDITRQTLHNYRVRMKTDDDLLQLFTLKCRILLVEWQQDTTRTIKVALNELNRRMPIATEEEDAKVIQAIGNILKICGELKIASEALADDTIVSAGNDT